MGRRLKLDIPGPDRRCDFEEVRRGGWEACFRPQLRTPLRLIVEIGFGRGEFLMDLAAHAPEIAFVGVERSAKRVLKMTRRLARSDLQNVRLIDASAEQVVGELLQEGSVETFWINFSDPWPKKRHAGRRLIRAPFVQALALRLVPGGQVHLATDYVPYAEQIHEVLTAEPGLVNVYAPDPWLADVPGRKPTAYELEWRAEGRPLHFFSYARRLHGS